MTYSKRHFFAALLFLTASFFCFRIPYFTQTLVGEEGIFAYPFIHEVHKPYWEFLSRINGEDQMVLFQHPGPLFGAIELMGRVGRSLVDFRVLDPVTSATILRMLFSLPHLFVSVAALIYVYRKRNATLYYWTALLIAFISSPVVLITSTELHVDASFGVLALGIWSLAALAREESPDGRRTVMDAGLFVGALVAGLGKNEWSVVLLPSMLLVLAFFAVTKRRRPDCAEHVRSALYGCGGLLAGNLASYLYDPVNYVTGLQLMLSMSKNESILKWSGFLKLLSVNKLRWAYLPLHMTLLAAVSYLSMSRVKFMPKTARYVALFLPLAGLTLAASWSEYVSGALLAFFAPLLVLAFSLALWPALLGPENPPAEPGSPVLITALFSAAIFGAYFLSAWDGGPRYFAVALVASLFALLGLLKHHPEQVEKKVVAALTVCVLVLSGIAQLKKETFSRYPTHARVSTDSSDGCLPVMSSGEAVFGSMDFLSSACSKEYFAEMSKRYGKPLCK